LTPSSDHKSTDGSLARLQRVLTSANVAAFEWDITTGALWWSDELFRLLGHAPGDFCPTVEKILTMVPPGTLEAAGDLQGPPDGSRRFDDDVTIRTRDGHAREFRAAGLIAFGSDGRPSRVTGALRDVTHQKQTERRLERIFDTASDLIFFHELPGGPRPPRFIAVNDEVCRVLGYRREELLSMGPADLVDAEEGALIAEKSAALVETGELRFTSTLHGREGATIRVEMRSRLLEEPDGPMVVTIARDVTARERAHRDLVERERQHRLLIDSLPAYVAYVDRDGVYQRVNAEYARRFGCSESQIVGRSIQDMVPRESYEKGLPALARALRGEVASFVQESTGPDGEIHAYDVRFTPDLDGGEVRGFYALATDITEVLATERRLRASDLERQRLLTAIEKSDDSILVTDADGMIQFVNAAFERNTGYTAAEVVGGKPSLLKSGRHAPEFYMAIWAKLRGGEPWSGRLVNRRKDGSLFTELATISPVFDDSGRIINYVAVKRDITPILELEEAVRQAQKMEALGQLAGGIAHDFNNLLQTVMGNTELAMGDLDPAAPAVVRLQASLNACGRGRDLVQQILTFSRRHEPRREPLDLTDAVEESLDLLRSTLPASVTLVTPSPAAGLSVAVDRTEVHQVLMNLASNAVQAMPDRKGRLTIAVEAATRPGPDGDAAAVVLRVTDDGQGMSADVAARCCEPYFTTKPVGEGTGMGLSIVHGIVTSLGGELDVQSAPDRGTAVRILLPVTGAVEAAPPPVVPGSPGLRGAPVETDTPPAVRILVVEDEPSVLGLIQVTLERAGYAVVPYGDPQAALAAFHADPDAIDLVVTDQTMPSMTGVELAQQVHAVRPDLPIIVCSGYTAQFSPERARELGFREFLAKPVAIGDLKRAVAAALAAEPVRSVLS
jgi:PAS domain S-box-containing protein